MDEYDFEYINTELIEGGRIYIDRYQIGSPMFEEEVNPSKVKVHVVIERILDPYSFEEHWIFKKSGRNHIDAYITMSVIINWLTVNNELSDVMIKIIICTFNIRQLKSYLLKKIENIRGLNIREKLSKYPELLECFI